MSTGNLEPGSRRWFDLRTAAVYCAVSVKCVRAAIATGKLPRARLGKKFIVDVRDLDRWILGEMLRLDA